MAATNKKRIARNESNPKKQIENPDPKTSKINKRVFGIIQAIKSTYKTLV